MAEHLHACAAPTSGPSALTGGPAAAAAAAVAMSRFWRHAATTCEVLAEPLQELVRQQTRDDSVALCVHDWCALTYAHRRKRDRLRRTHARDVGYDLLSALVVCAATGRPAGVMEFGLRTWRGVIGTRLGHPRRPAAHLEQLLPVMRASRAWRLRPRLVHVVDREADSVDHYRRWAADGHYFLVRADDRRVRWGRGTALLSDIVAALRRAKRFARRPDWRGRDPGDELWLADAAVVLHRPAKKNVRGRRWAKAGPALPLRFVATQVRRGGRVVAEWWLLTNVPADWADAARLAQWYYWRWGIESYHKVLKTAGQNVEEWLQADGRRVAKRLAVANMACALVWRLQRADGPGPQQLRDILIELSGRQMKPAVNATTAALLDGLEKLLAVLKVTERVPLSDLKRLLTEQMPELFQGTEA